MPVETIRRVCDIAFPDAPPAPGAYRVEVNWNPGHPNIPEGWEAAVAQAQPYGALTVAELHPRRTVVLRDVVGRFAGAKLYVATDAPGLAVVEGDEEFSLEPGVLYEVGPQALVVELHAPDAGRCRRVIAAKSQAGAKQAGS